MLSTPFLGITGSGPRATVQVRRTRSSFQLPLSGSQREKCGWRSCSTITSFNSLSRDHDEDDELFSKIVNNPELSTPSLGITSYELASDRRGSGLPSFNSLSRDHKNTLFLCQNVGQKIFQLPLSGSLFGAAGESKPVCFLLSTPSLGITVDAGGLGMLSASIPFNSLSRDHISGRSR